LRSRGRCRGSLYKFFRRRIRRRSCFRFHFVTRFLGSVVIANGRPAEIDRNLGNVLFHRPRPFARLRRRNHRRSHDHGFALNKRPWCFDVHVDTGVAFQAESLHRLAALRANFVIIRPLIHDRRIVISDVGDIGGLINDRDVAFRREDSGLGSLGAEFSCRNKTILIRADVVIVIRPIVDTRALIESRFWRQGRPANVIVALSPRHPGRGPLLTWDPDPADSPQPCPTSVMISRPTEWLFRNPSPAGIGVNPAPVRVRTPTLRALCFARLPNIAVISGL